MKTSADLKYFVSYCLWEIFFDSNWTQTPSELISFTILLTLRSATMFQPKFRAIKYEKSAKICLTGKLLLRAFH